VSYLENSDILYFSHSIIQFLSIYSVYFFAAGVHR